MHNTRTAWSTSGAACRHPQLRAGASAVLREDPDVVLVGEMLTSRRSGRAPDRGDRPPDLRDAPYQLRVPDHQPDYRRVPGARAGTDPTTLSLVLEGILCQACCRRRPAGTRPGDRADDPNAAIRNLIGRTRSPDLLGDADRPDGIRDADLQPEPGRPVLQEADLAAVGAGPFLQPEELQDMINRGSGLVTAQSPGPGRPPGPGPAGVHQPSRGVNSDRTGPNGCLIGGSLEMPQFSWKGRNRQNQF